MFAIASQHPVLATFEVLLIGVWVWATLSGIRAEWRHRVGGHPRPSIDRGENSWRDFSLAWVVVMGFAGPLVGLAYLPSGTATLWHTVNALVVFQLVFVSEPGRNRVLRFTRYVRNIEK